MSDYSEIVDYLSAYSEVSVNPIEVLHSIFVSVSLSVLLAITYEKTYAGATYSRSFVQTIVLGSLVSTIMIIAIGNNIARGLGILGALTIIRFRTPIRDPRDMIFIFASLAVGIASGSHFYSLGAMGVLSFCLVTFLLELSAFSSRKRYDGLLRFFRGGEERLRELSVRIVERYCKSHETVAMRDTAEEGMVECALQVKLIHPDLQQQLINDLRELEGIEDVSLIMQRDSVEV